MQAEKPHEKLMVWFLFSLQVLHKKSMITDLSISGDLTMLKNCDISWLHHFCYINDLLLFLLGVPVVWVSLCQVDHTIYYVGNLIWRR